jgi:DNA (cytosine-5)-methyltransferase 1
MRYLSVCSGIEAASVAWHPLGWEPLAFSEIEAFPRAVLTHHYPDTPLHGNFTVLRDQPWIADADVLVGGTPCQAFSVAGLRNSLADDRGNLTLEFVRLADAIDDLRSDAGKNPAVIVWENVPGVLSVRDNAFGCFLAALAGEDTPLLPTGGKWTNAGVVVGPKRKIAWRVLDAQYFGLAQRRRRVFVVASARKGFDPAAVLLEFEGLRRDTPPRREAGQVAPTIPSRSTAGGGLCTDFDCDGGVIRQWPADLAPTLNAAFGEKQGLEDKHALGGAGLFVPSVSPTLRAGGNQTGGDRPPGTDVDTADSLIVTHSLRGEGFDASEDGTGRGTPLVPCEPYTLAIRGRGDTHNLEYRQDGTANAILTPNGGRAGIGVGAVAVETGKGDAAPCVATFQQSSMKGKGTIGYDDSGIAKPVKTQMDGQMLHQHMAVRRLTPVECERLQGFPDGYTNIPWRGKPEAPDGPRYKALGNSMAVPVMRWIGRRIAAELARSQSQEQAA